MPPRVFFPNFPLVLRLKAAPKTLPKVQMPEPGIEGTFKTTELVLETVQQLTKPQMKHFLTNVYGLDVKRINSINVMGRRRNENTTMPVQGKDYKRFYVKLNDEVELPNVPKSLDDVKKAARKEAQ